MPAGLRPAERPAIQRATPRRRPLTPVDSSNAPDEGAPRRGLVLLPTYNERENVALVTRAILEARPELDVLVIDDASPDGTGAIADALAAADPRIFVLHRPGKQGLGRAYVDGIRWGLGRAAGYPHLITMDADFSHDPGRLGALLDACEAGADLAIGSRYVAGGSTVGWTRRRLLLSRAGGLYARAVLGFAVRDPTAGFVCYRREALEALALELGGAIASGYGFQIEMKYRAHRRGLRLREVPITFPDRRRGASKMSTAIMIEALGLCVRLRLRGDR